MDAHQCWHRDLLWLTETDPYPRARRMLRSLRSAPHVVDSGGGAAALQPRSSRAIRCAHIRVEVKGLQYLTQPATVAPSRRRSPTPPSARRG